MNTLRKLIVGMILAALSFLAQAGPVTLTNFVIEWGTATPTAGGVGLVRYATNGSWYWDSSFPVHINPWQAALDDRTVGVAELFTPIAGTGVDFDPVDLFSIGGYFYNAYYTSMGYGQLGGSAPMAFDGFLAFPQLGGANWAVNFDDPVQNVPEPDSLALLGLGLLGVAGITTRKKNKKGIVIIRTVSVINHLILAIQNNPSACRGIITKKSSPNYSL